MINLLDVSELLVLNSISRATLLESLEPSLHILMTCTLSWTVNNYLIAAAELERVRMRK